ncbi:cytochrome P450 [Streptomyces sp. B1866]|uniref:cytochrome P450 n=1 Tax=Streptomyces sp. B1866 TaxID=3075431 RepID=UPI0028911EAA|nr:cytochrome P450 [Streptomyces sp. B1866]MDT3395815.1 cytochrome P450 [Streptomyces sp. B1866]
MLNINVRTSVMAWLGRKYLPRLQGNGFDLSKLTFLPATTLAPLRRHGLDPVPELARTRVSAPVSSLPLPFGLTAWLVTGYDAVKAVLGRPDGFSSDFTHLQRNVGVVARHSPGGLGFSDPPAHTRLRRLLTPEFTAHRLARLTPRIHAIVDERLAEMAARARDGRPVDLVQAFALPVPSLVICELLGVPYADRADFQRLSTARFDLYDGADASFGAISDSLSYLLDIVAGQRRAPGDGLLGRLIREHGDEIGDEELAGLADGVLTGGLETTASMLALGTLVLLRDPEHFALIRDGGTRGGADAAADGNARDGVVDRFVEELLRYLTVVQVAFPRFAREDMEIAGVRISRGDLVVCSLSGANRDEDLGPGMERFDPHRGRVPSHLAFGYGIHRCVGAELARMELRAAYPALVRAFPRMRLAVDPAALSFRRLSIVYGVDALPVLLNP